MGGIYKRKNTSKNKMIHRQRKNKGFTRDTDQIHDDLKPENFNTMKNQPMNESLPGLGQHYCVACARYFVDLQSIQVHEKSKLHKRFLKRAKETPFTQKEADEAGKY